METRTLTLGGRTWTFTLPSPALVNYAIRRAVTRRLTHCLPPGLTDDERVLLLEIILEAADSFRADSPAGIRTLATRQGTAFFLWAGLKDHHPELSPAEVKQWLDQPGAVDVVADFIEELKRSR